MKVYILRGLPASGKTTLARQMQEKNQNLVRICKHDLRKMFFLNENRTEYNPNIEHWEGINEIRLSAIRNMLIDKFLKFGCDIVLDGLHGSDEKLIEVKQFCQGKADVEVIEVNTSINECIYRDSQRAESLGAGKITKLSSIYFRGKNENKNNS